MNQNVTGQGFIPIHIAPFQEEGEFFAKCPEMRLVARGESEAQAIVNLLNMAAASLMAAHMRGNLLSVVEKSGLKIVPSQPAAARVSAQGLNVFLPVLTDAGPRPSD